MANRRPPSQRPERQKTHGLPPRRSSPDLNRDAIAEAVHRACCDLRGEDNAGGCHMYAAAGFYLLYTRDRPAAFSLQAGSFRIQPDPEDPTFWFAMEAGDRGFARGEVHCWLANPAGELIDFSARHYRDMTTRLHNVGLDEQVRWTRPDPPAYLWCHESELPTWVRFRADMSACLAANAQMNGGLDVPGGSGDLFRSAERHYRALAG